MALQSPRALKSKGWCCWQHSLAKEGPWQEARDELEVGPLPEVSKPRLINLGDRDIRHYHLLGKGFSG